MVKSNGNPSDLDKPAAELLRWLPPELAREVVKRWRAMNELMASEWGSLFYEILSCSIEVDIHDRDGTRATFRRREEIQALQDNVRAYQDFFWGDGNPALQHASSAGSTVHSLDENGKRHVLVWLDVPMRRGETRIVENERLVKNMFTAKREWHEVVVRHFVHRISVSILFPRRRSPIRAKVEHISPQGHEAGHRSVNYRLVPTEDSRWKLKWESLYPAIGSSFRTEWFW